MIQIRGLSKEFLGQDGAGTGVLAIDSLNFEVRDNEFITVIGPSGCGKTTLLRIIAGLIPFDSGEVCINGVPVTRPGPGRGFPELRSVALGRRFGQCCVRTRNPRLIEVGVRGYSDAAGKTCRPRGIRAKPAKAALWRHATACRPCPGVGGESTDLAYGRTVWRPR